ASPISACISPHPRLKSIHVQLLPLETETTISTYTAERCASTGPALPLLTRPMVFPCIRRSFFPPSFEHSYARGRNENILGCKPIPNRDTRRPAVSCRKG